jgi:hypothetical protein
VYWRARGEGKVGWGCLWVADLAPNKMGRERRGSLPATPRWSHGAPQGKAREPLGPLVVVQFPVGHPSSRRPFSVDAREGGAWHDGLVAYVAFVAVRTGEEARRVGM